jgi:hypothetical protein
MNICTNCGEMERDCCCKKPDLVEYAETERDEIVQICARLSRSVRALNVIVKTPAIRAWLLAKDPKALEQCEDALTYPTACSIASNVMA